MRARLIRAVLALYPTAIRERYGEEIAELLATSDTPARDLADTARCALRDRLTHRTETMTLAQARTAAATLIKLVVAPFAFGVLLLALLTTAGLLADMTGAHEATPYGYALAVALAAASTWWSGRRMARTMPIVAAAVVVPAALALGAAGISAVPHVGDVLGEVRAGSLAAVACWAAGATGLGWAVSVLLRRGRRAAAWLSSGIGALLLLDAVTAVYVFTALPPERAPRHNAPLWYLSSMSWWDPGLVDGAYLQLEDSIKMLPPVLTMCTVFLLGVTASRPRPAA
ncbi:MULTISPECIES: hypothetical protein [Micromonospora]|uniref:ABC transporter permease n=1 Tax=Micromonospora solifontis TaxID=2487138 RepID=A0ABX9WBJ8_9ACTN|nr:MULTISPECIES: hypothetical protein [Micromonospora]NES17071.1 hypothetical protein [Micromonospora sp. PPF5-17B]NES38595.1 hypothetical protein [Micromonospora solifontis]NES58773.1 hypothetical protein [Micromonospora sp. PPF5-6]RNL94567.1 hypothetical protein EFE23_20970 [Micromonospora solifontis]